MKQLGGFWLLFLWATIVSFAQQPENQLLTSPKWVILEDAMHGIGKHISLQEKAWIKFDPNGQWTASEAIEGTSKGKWTTDAKGKIWILLGEGKKAEITKITDNSLKIRLKAGLQTREWTWKKEI